MPRRKNQSYYSEIQSFIKDFWDDNSCSPTTSEIADGTGIPRATVGRYLAEMKEKGMIVYDGRRDFRTESQVKSWGDGTEVVPLVGSIACGLPKLAEQNIEEYVQLPRSLFGRGKFYLLRASGDSMINVGINTGDLVLIREQSVAEYGQIVVAQVGDEDATLKTYRPATDKKTVVLHAGNDALEDVVVNLETEKFEIQGVVKYVIHRLP